MKMILFLVISCLALNNGNGAPTTAVYKFVKCNPEGGQANCVTQQSPEMTYSPDLPAKLPASTAQYLEAEPEEDESPLWEEEEEKEEELPMTNEVPEEGSGGFEGSAAEGPFMAAQGSLAEMGSGESWTEKDTMPFIGGRAETRGMRWLIQTKSLPDGAKPAEQELKEDYLLHQ